MSTFVDSEKKPEKVPTVDVPTRLFGNKGTNPIPLLEKLWDFYAAKGVKTVFISLGTSSSPLAELEIAETLGCPINVVEYDSDKLELWNKTTLILKSRKDSEETTCDFTNEVAKKWVLPKNLRITKKLPFFYNGSIELSGNVIETVQLNQYVETVCEAMNISQENARIDILNVQLGNELEQSVLYSFLNNCYRPGLVVINYTNKPDSHLLSTLVAGHLQNIGYMLIAKEDSKFLYTYNDKNVYEFCSYETKNIDNPLIYEFLKSAGFYSSKK